MKTQSTIDPVTRVIKECLRDEETASKIFHLIAEEHHRRIVLADDAIELDEEQVGEFVQRYSSEVEPEFWESKRRKH